MLERRWNRARLKVAAAVASSCSLPFTASAQAPEYAPFDALTNQLEALVDRTDRASMRPIGLSGEGREIWLIEVLGPGDAPAAERPGVLVVANLEADHVVGSQITLEILRTLVEGDPGGFDALTDRVLYLVPRLNPDGAEAMFGPLLADGGRNHRPFDDDNDGRIDEDPPEDLNGDGLITLMRVPDPLGGYVVHEDDERLVQEADASSGRAGAIALYWEGVDSDGDGFYNEDGLGGVDLNRNFQHAYPYYERDAGPHMVSEPETRALMDFVIAHRNIAAVLTFGHTDNLVSPIGENGALASAHIPDLPQFADSSFEEIFTTGIFGAGTASGGIDLRGVQVGADNNAESGTRPATEVHGDDVPYFIDVAERYREVTGIERVSLNRAPEGAFFQYAYFHFGVPAFTTQGWPLPEPPAPEEEEAAEAEEGASGFDADALRALTALGVEAFVEWTPFDHPELGTVEIGGFRPYALTNPPPERISELGTSHAAFLMDLAGLLPRIAIVETEVESHGGGLFTISAEVANQGFFPTALRQGVVAGSVDPVTVQIEVPFEDLVTGDAKSSQIPTLAGSGTRTRFEWLIRGSVGESVEIWARAQKGGTDRVTVQLGGEE